MDAPVIGLIDSLNGAPPTLGVAEDFAVRPGTPGQLAAWLLEGTIAAGFVPVVEALELGQEFIRLPFVIASPHTVRSVVLFGAEGEDPRHAHHLWLDPRSRTSNRLVRFLFPQCSWGLHDGSADIVDRLQPGEAALLIGDEALRLTLSGRPGLDVAAAWQAATGTMAVFAQLLVNPALMDEEQQRVLQRRVQGNLWHLPEQYATLAQRYGFTEDAVRAYLETNIQYHHTNAVTHALYPLAARLRLPPPPPRHTRRVTGEIGFDVAQGRRLSMSDALTLTAAPLPELAAMAQAVRQHHNPGGKVSYIIERNINYTNVCDVYCRFCAFYKPPGKGGYVIREEALAKKLDELVAAGGVQVLLQGGLNPDLRLSYYEELFRFIKQGWNVAIHGLSPDEVLNIARIENMSVPAVLEALMAAGMDSLPGAGGEILEPRTRHRIAMKKSSPGAWLGVMVDAHRLGMKTSATMMYGVGETWRDRLVHLARLRQVQDLTGGFMAFITWPYQQGDLHLKATAKGAEEYLRVQALCRLFLDNVPHVQSSWVTMGPTVAQVALRFGADDYGSVMFEENVVSAAGTTFCMDEPAMRRNITEAGFEPIRRGKNYQPLAS